MAPTPILTPVPRSRSARPAAFWLAGTGALLLLAAAGVLVAIQWDDIAAWAKLAGLVAVNGAVVAAGLRFRSVVPATARALHHLGALMIPVAVVATTVQLGLGWEWVLLAGSVLGGLGIAALDRVWSSTVLEGVTAAAVIPFAGAIAALTAIPPSFVLIAVALVGATRAQRGAGVWWAATIVWAVLAPSLTLVAAIDDPLVATSDIAAALGLTGAVAAWTHLLAGIGAGIALGIVARRDDDFALALGALGAPVIGAVAWFTGEDPGAVGPLSAAVLALVAVEFAGASLRHGSFWGRVVARVLPGVEVVFGVATFLLLVHAVDAGEPGSDLGSVLVAVCTSVATVAGWVLADRRRGVQGARASVRASVAGSGWWPATVGLAAGVLAAAFASDLGSVPTLAVAIGLAAVLVPSGRGGAHGVVATLIVGVVGFVAVADLRGGEAALTELELAGVALASALVLAAAASMRGPRGDLGAVLLTVGAVVMGPMGVEAAASDARIAEFLGRLDTTGLWWSVGVLVVAGLIVLAERGSTDPIVTRTGIPARVLVVMPFLPAFLGSPETHLIAPALVLVGLVALDVLRTGDIRLVAPALVVGPVVASTSLMAAAVATGSIGIVLAVLAVGVCGVALASAGRTMADVASVAPAVSALVHGADSPSHLSSILILLAGAVLVSRLLALTPDRVLTAGALATAGIWMRLDLEGIDWAEAWIAMPALTLVGIAVVARPGRLSSWFTTGPAVALVGYAALAERILLGGGGGHALTAGTIAVLAIVAGAHLRLAGPLVIGTLVLLLTVGHESLGYAASVPTWAWLALGGVTLLGAGVAVERGATTPVESARKTVTTVCAEFR